MIQNAATLRSRQHHYHVIIIGLIVAVATVHVVILFILSQISAKNHNVMENPVSPHRLNYLRTFYAVHNLLFQSTFGVQLKIYIYLLMLYKITIQRTLNWLHGRQCRNHWSDTRNIGGWHKRLLVCLTVLTLCTVLTQIHFQAGFIILWLCWKQNSHIGTTTEKKYNMKQ